ncbi:MAG: hypothetical protein ACO24D_18085 [bacterium]|jgi:hypothetical protein
MNLITTNELSQATGISIDKLRKLHQSKQTKTSKQFTPRGPILWSKSAVTEINELLHERN